MIQHVLIAGVGALTVTGCGSNDGSTGSRPTNDAPETFVVSGTLTLDGGNENVTVTDDAWEVCQGEKLDETGSLSAATTECVDLKTGVSCEGKGGYDDLVPGTQVLVTDSSGRNIGLGSLDAGVSGLYGESCAFTFRVPDVPSDGGVYSVEVGHRGALNFSEGDASSLAFSIGG